MCGIVGAVGKNEVSPVLLEGLAKLEYRGYDSAGMAVINSDGIQRLRVTGKVARLAEALEQNPLRGHLGIAHTRWATHGEPSTHNAHPHFSNDEIAIVHNGIIENYSELREQLIKEGYRFESQTDTEVVAHLIHRHNQNNDFLTAVRLAVQALEGAYSLAIMSVKNPGQLIGVKSGSPLVVGLGEDENFLASDTLALLNYTKNFIYLEEGDFVLLEQHHVSILDKAGERVERKVHHLKITPGQALSKGEFAHYMLKEIFDQPETLSDSIGGYVNHNHIIAQSFGHQASLVFPKIKRVHLVACGTSYHAALVARCWLEALAGLPCQVDVASEDRYRKKVVEPDTLFVALSQSGETADTLAALRQSKKDGYAATLAICNVAESSLVREADISFMIRAGIEIGVAATKTFSAQLVALMLLTLNLGQYRGIDKTQEFEIIKALKHLPVLAQECLNLDSAIKKLSSYFTDKTSALFLGRGMQFPIALEGALKLKEISYIHAEAYPAGELKHGPLALVDKGLPVIVLAPADELSQKLASNIQEVKARGGELFVFADSALNWKSSEQISVINLPSTNAYLSPIVFNIPLQLLAYHVAVLKGTDVDQPRNLAKSVTVE